ncbi:unnamed protein product [Ranitomeya imitator]|uniref:BHLH domain-containing protein n=1 Tax=Ranitomeya imitator TaxID=111125 RepID=A0ABN9MQ14_9NEOB|nr:unnamed protein product [Ranitomeya imitator]
MVDNYCSPISDDEDSDYRQESIKDAYKDRRRRAHTQAEQKRRDAIKKGYDDLQTIVPTCQQQDCSIGSQKLSKAVVLQKTIDYIQFLHKEKKKQEEEVSTLRKEVMALKIMKSNYEQIVKAHQNNPHEGTDQVPDQVKFSVFQGIMDSLFQTFNASISVNSFQELSACVFSWIEEHCKPQVCNQPYVYTATSRTDCERRPAVKQSTAVTSPLCFTAGAHSQCGKLKARDVTKHRNGKHRVTKRSPALSNPMFTLVTSDDIAESASHTLIQRCQREIQRQNKVLDFPHRPTISQQGPDRWSLSHNDLVNDIVATSQKATISFSVTVP